MSPAQIKTLISASQISARITELSQEISSEYQDKNAILVSVLKGSFIFLADLSRELWRQDLTDFEIDFMGISSYGNDTETSKNPHITKDLTTNIENRHVILVEDIVDTGYSLESLQRILKQRSPASLSTVVLLSKPSRREIDVKVEYIGFEIDGWIGGYGLDFEQKERGRPDIVKLIRTS